jgi:hypothetical protein
MSFDPNKPVQTRDGRRARIIATDIVSTKDERPIAAVIEHDIYGEYIAQRYSDGRTYGNQNTSGDLVNVAPRLETFYNVYRDAGGVPYVGTLPYLSVESADANAGTRRIGLIKLTAADDVLKRVEAI